MLYLVTMNIPEKFHIHRVTTRLIGGSTSDHELHCGFLRKNGPLKKIRKFEFYSALLILEGTGTYEDELGRKYEIGPGDCIQRLPGIAHTSTINKGPWQECYIVFGRHLFESLTQLGLVSDSRPVLRAGVDLGLVERFYGFQAQLSQAKDSELFRCLITAESLLASIYELAEPGHSREKMLAERASHLLGKRLGERCDTQELLIGMELSYERIRKIFTAQFGVSPHAYRIRRRIDRACELLREGSLSISEIAIQLGYPDPFTFSRQFMKERSISPSAYRKQM